MNMMNSFSNSKGVLFLAACLTIFHAKCTSALAANISVENTGNTSIFYEKFTDGQQSCANKIDPSSTVILNRDEISRFCINRGSAKVIGCPKYNGSSYPIDSDQIVSEFCLGSPVQGENDFHPGGWNTSIPYIVSPRYTKLLTPFPILRWNNINSEKPYEVKLCRIDLFGREDCFWHHNTLIGLTLRKDYSLVEMPYANKEFPNLEPGTYTLRVKSGFTSSTMEQEPSQYSSNSTRQDILGSQFQVVSSEESSKIISKTYVLKASKSPNPAGVEVDIAFFYASNGFYADAIQELEDFLLRKEGRVNASVYESLGDLYKQVGLNLLAVKNYKKSDKLEKLKRICGKFPENTLPGECPPKKTTTEFQPK
jgi:hypothetical protein